jgi:4-hydroxy-2-oxoglutarate aldolase
MSRLLEGVLGPVATPFDAAEELDVAAFEANLSRYMEVGLHGVVVAGSTGEAPLLSDRERLLLLEAARRVVPSDRWLIAGAGAESTRAAVERSRAAAAAGADAVMVVAPHYYGNAMTREALYAHFSRLADCSPVPVLLYNIPKYVHFRLEPELVTQLASHPNVVGMKDSAGDLACLAKYLEVQGEDFSVFTGHGGTFAAALDLGVRGGILAVALFAWEAALQVWRAHREGRMSEAQDAQRRLAPLAAEIVAAMGVAGVKSAMSLVGLDGGAVRSPLQQLEASQVERVAALLREAEVALAA